MVMRLEQCPKAAPIVDISEEFYWNSIYDYSVDPLVLDCCSGFRAADDIHEILEDESGRPNQGTLSAVTGEQKPSTFDVSKKRRGAPLDDEGKKERKRIADKKYREKAKAYVKDMESQLQAANSKIERCKSAFELLEEKSQKLQVAATENEKLRYEIKRLEDHVGRMEEELRGLKGINASPMEGNVTMANDLQIGAINPWELQHKICYILQQQLVNMFGPNHIQGFPKEQEQLGQEGNGRLGFEGDGGHITGTIGSKIQFMQSQMSQQANAEEGRIDCAEATNHIYT